MANTEALRTFLAVYRAGSVTNGARHRLISQPAASQHLASLERSMGAPLFTRTSGGVEPTAKGRELYGAVAPALDRLEPILSGLDGGKVSVDASPVRIGTTAEYFAARVVPALVGTRVRVSAEFGDSGAVLRLLEAGEVDIAITALSPNRRQISTMVVSTEHFALVTSSALAPPRPLRSLHEAGEWLSGRPWVAYSQELPITRRFWQRALGRPFAAELKLAAPDLRVVANAVAAGLGSSLLPTYVVDDLVSRGVLVELFVVADEVPSQPWFASTLSTDAARDEVVNVLGLLQNPKFPGIP